MTGMKRLLLLVPLTAVLLPALAGVARAEGVQDVVAGLRSNPIYQTKGADLLDSGALQSTMSGSHPKLYVAVLPANAAASAADAHTRAVEIGSALGDTNGVVLVITLSKHLGTAEGNGASNQGVDASRALADQLSAHKGQPFDKEHVTTFVKELKQRLDAQVSSGGGSSSSPSSSSGGGGKGGTMLAVLLVLAVIGFLLFTRSSRKRKAAQQEGLRADVEQLYNRLGSDVSLLSPGDNAVAKQAMSDASERYNSCGAALATADSAAEFAAARRTAVEGLTAARVARKELGLDPGPEIPLPAGGGPQLTEEQQLQLGDQTVFGSPQYAPGRQHYYGGGMVGGQMVRGGWYSAPFWEPFLLGSLLSGGFGGGGLFGGGGGFERGYEEGRDSAQQDSGFSGGGDWGGGGGGDWSGGGDWGGGGGDMGGGGGDW
ncbi:MAG: hypothetical protein JWN31_2121 [Frankiales bacterium]|nr:hypothetical protein [Frankiales bacterium]